MRGPGYAKGSGAAQRGGSDRPKREGAFVNIREALRRGSRLLAEAGSEEAGLEAELLLAHTLHTDRSHLFQRLRDRLAPDVEGAGEEELRLKACLFASRVGEHPRAAAEGLADAHERAFPFRAIRPTPLRRSRSLRVPRPSHSKNLLAAQDDKWGLTRAGLRGDATARLHASPQ